MFRFQSDRPARAYVFSAYTPLSNVLPSETVDCGVESV